MSPLVARILLALLALPIAATVYAGLLVALVDRSRLRDLTAFVLTGSVTAVAVVVYWILIWRRQVRWTPRRITMTWVSGLAALVGGAVVGGVLGPMVEDSFGVFMGTVVAVLGWLTLTVIAWRERPEERRQRLARQGAEVVVCPSCGYNLSGLRQTTCPECGATPTLDELLAGQPGRAEAELER